MNTSDRIARLRDALQDEGLDAILVSSRENRHYLSGFTGSAGYLLVSHEQAVLATDFRYVEQARGQAVDFRVLKDSGKGHWLKKTLEQTAVNRVGFEAQDLTVSAHSALTKALGHPETQNGIELVETQDLLDKIRVTKSSEELGHMARAIEITDLAFEEVSHSIRPGITEKNVAWQLEKAMRERGAEAPAFDTIVASGPNGAMPHHAPCDKVLEHGEPVVVDMGARYEGYCADLSRTVVVGGSGDEKFWRIYETVLRAQLNAEDEIKSGMTGAEIDAISRNVIALAGYKENFGHSLGHGVGLAVHELPHVSPNAKDVIEDGMVFTIEPGIYLSGWGGVRIEDIVVLENGRAKVMSKAPKLQPRLEQRT